MTRLHDLSNEQGQSPWLDNLKRGWITGGELQAWVDKGIRGITSNPSIFQKAMSTGNDYDGQLGELVGAGTSIEESYWALVASDIEDALAIMRPVFDESNGEDGYVSVEVDPGLARDTDGTIAAARGLNSTIDEPNLYIKIPATEEGIPAIRQMISESCSVNVTLIFSLARYDDVIEAYLSGLEAVEGDLSAISSVASFFLSRVDVEVDNRLDAIGSEEALALRGKAAIANAKAAYKLFTERFSGERWEALAARGARVQRPLWASTSTKNDAYSDVLYVDELIGPNTVNTLPDATIEAFLDHGTIARTIDVGVEEAEATLAALTAVGIDLTEVTDKLETEGVAAFEKSFVELLETLDTRAATLRP